MYDIWMKRDIKRKIPLCHTKLSHQLTIQDLNLKVGCVSRCVSNSSSHQGSLCESTIEKLISNIQQRSWIIICSSIVCWGWVTHIYVNEGGNQVMDCRQTGFNQWLTDCIWKPNRKLQKNMKRIYTVCLNVIYLNFFCQMLTIFATLMS